jgi:hypothetical protein
MEVQRCTSDIIYLNAALCADAAMGDFFVLRFSILCFVCVSAQREPALRFV